MTLHQLSFFCGVQHQFSGNNGSHWKDESRRSWRYMREGLGAARLPPGTLCFTKTTSPGTDTESGQHYREPHLIFLHGSHQTTEYVWKNAVKGRKMSRKRDAGAELHINEWITSNNLQLLSQKQINTMRKVKELSWQQHESSVLSERKEQIRQKRDLLIKRISIQSESVQKVSFKWKNEASPVLECAVFCCYCSGIITNFNLFSSFTSAHYSLKAESADCARDQSCEEHLFSEAAAIQTHVETKELPKITKKQTKGNVKTHRSFHFGRKATEVAELRL